jgi:hypothetical protein
VRIAKIIKSSKRLKNLKDQYKLTNILGNKNNFFIKSTKRRKNLTIEQKRNFDKLVELGIKFNKGSLDMNAVTSNDQIFKINTRKETINYDEIFTERELIKDFNEEEKEINIPSEKQSILKTNEENFVGMNSRKLFSKSRQSNAFRFTSKKPANTLKPKESMKVKLNLLNDNNNINETIDENSPRKKVSLSTYKYKRFNSKKFSSVGIRNFKLVREELNIESGKIYRESDDENEESESNENSNSESEISYLSEENHEDLMNEKEEEVMNHRIEHLKQMNKLHMNTPSIIRNKEEINYDKVNNQSVKVENQKQEEFLHNVSKKSNSKIQKILNENMVNQVVLVIMLILVILPLIDYEFLFSILYSNNYLPNRHYYCIDLIFMNMNYSLQNPDQNSLDALNRTVSNCFFTREYLDDNKELPSEIERFIYINFNESELFWQLNNKTKFMGDRYKIGIEDYEHYFEEHRYSLDYIKEIYAIDDNNNITLAYETVEVTRILQICMIVKSIYVSIFLVVGVYLSTLLVNHIVVTPLDIIFTKLNMNLKNIETSRNIEEQTDLDVAHVFKLNDLFNNSDLTDDIISSEPLGSDDRKLISGLETYFIDASLVKMLDMISMSIGNLAFPIIPYSNLNKQVDLNLTKTPMISFEGVGLFLFITNTDTFFAKYKNRCHSILSEIYSIFHSIGIIFSGEPYHKSEINAIFWKKNKSEWIKEANRYIFNLVTGKKPRDSIDYYVNKEVAENECFFNEILDSMAIFSGMKFLYVLFKDLQETVRTFKECKVNINLYVKSGVYMHGLFGTSSLLEEVYMGETIDQILKISVRLFIFINNRKLFILTIITLLFLFLRTLSIRLSKK